MKSDELKNALKTLGGLFPMQITQEQITFLREHLAELPFDAVEKAIRQHRATHEYLKFPQFLEGCRAAAFEHEAARNTSSREGSWADVYRRQSPHLAGRCDVEVMLRVHRDWWKRAEGAVDARNREALDRAKQDGRAEVIEFHEMEIDREKEPWRHKFRMSCIYLLVTTGMSHEVAEKWSEAVFNPDPHYFQQCLDDLRMNQPASSCA